MFIAEAAPVALTINNTRAGIPNIIITNSGELRFNVFKGPFTKNDQLTAAPFTDSFLYIPNVTASIANQVLPALNYGGPSKRSELEKELWGRGHVESRYRSWLEDMGKRQMQTTNATNLTLGYVTTDVRTSSPLAFIDTHSSTHVDRDAPALATTRSTSRCPTTPFRTTSVPTRPT